MIGKVAAIESASNFTDNQRRVTIKFEGVFTEFRMPENKLGIIGLALDDEVEVSFRPVREEQQEQTTGDPERDFWLRGLR